MKKIYVIAYDKWPSKAFSIKSGAEDYIKEIEKKEGYHSTRQLYDIVELDLE